MLSLYEASGEALRMPGQVTSLSASPSPCQVSGPDGGPWLGQVISPASAPPVGQETSPSPVGVRETCLCGTLCGLRGSGGAFQAGAGSPVTQDQLPAV